MLVHRCTYLDIIVFRLEDLLYVHETVHSLAPGNRHTIITIFFFFCCGVLYLKRFSHKIR